MQHTQLVSPYNHSFMTVIPIHGCKEIPISALHPEKVAEDIFSVYLGLYSQPPPFRLFFKDVDIYYFTIKLRYEESTVILYCNLVL